MSASQERQSTLDSVAPRFLVGDMEQALAFYGQFGFATPYHDEGFAILERDGIALQFNVSEFFGKAYPKRRAARDKESERTGNSR